ncbi:MAG TPA: T9SS type A sorting domain-containing protein [Bacteroidia bacterium]|nr:T9SS type A sorting domain-containing protein [Bacteroidia bacterium]
MKKQLLKLSTLLAIGGMLYFSNIESTNSHVAGAPAYCSGSPFDGGLVNGSCRQSGCHDSYVQQPAIPGDIITNVPDSGYTPGTTYTITCVSKRPVCKYFGFEFTTQNNASTGAEVGTLGNIATSGMGGTQLLSSSGAVWVTHVSSSTYNGGVDSCIWSFTWKAPNPGVGTVHCWAAFNGAVQNTSKKGTYVSLDSIQIPEFGVSGIGTITSPSIHFSVYPNPIKDFFTVNYTLNNSTQVEVNLYSIDGKKITTLLSEAETKGDYSKTLQIPDIGKGVYLVELIEGQQASYKKILAE